MGGLGVSPGYSSSDRPPSYKSATKPARPPVGGSRGPSWSPGYGGYRGHDGDSGSPGGISPHDLSYPGGGGRTGGRHGCPVTVDLRVLLAFPGAFGDHTALLVVPEAILGHWAPFGAHFHTIRVPQERWHIREEVAVAVVLLITVSPAPHMVAAQAMTTNPSYMKYNRVATVEVEDLMDETGLAPAESLQDMIMAIITATGKVKASYIIKVSPLYSEK